MATASGVIVLFPANQVNGEDIEIRDPASGEVLMTWHGLAPAEPESEGKPNYLSDFRLVENSGQEDIGAFAVTSGFGIEPHVKRS